MGEPNNITLDRSWKVYVCVTLFTWVLLTYQGLITAIEIWTISDVFNHCYIVLPASFYLMWEKRHEIKWSEIKLTLLPLPFLLGQVVVYLFGLAGDIQVFMHIATFTMLPTLIWMIVGNTVAKQIVFPLAFMVFAIPIGEELVPFLQEITADFSVMLLDLTGVPLFRSGLYIEIPQGKFLVAEACSGISFLIASIVLGNLYAYMNLRTWKARIFFVLLSVLFPIAANVVRVYGIIIIGYMSDMEHAVGADHLIYGWFFFAFVLVCLFLIGEFVRKKESKHFYKNKKGIDEPPNRNMLAPQGSFKVSVYIFVPIAVMGLGVLKMANLTLSGAPSQTSKFNLSVPYEQTDKRLSRVIWEPYFEETAYQINENFLSKSDKFQLYLAIYTPFKGELISSLNRVYVQDRWTFSEIGVETVSDSLVFNKHFINSSAGDYKRVYFVYIIGDKSFTKRINAKLYQTWHTLINSNLNSALIAVAFDGENNRDLSASEKEILNTIHIQVTDELK
jgi:exosortase A